VCYIESESLHELNHQVYYTLQNHTDVLVTFG